MKKIYLLILLATFALGLFAQEKVNGYVFTPIEMVAANEVESQGSTGTCWCFSSHSFLESELARMGKPMVDLSEMYAVYYTYMRKAENYVRRHGKANFDEGSLGHDAIYAMANHGLVTEEAYTGLLNDEKRHDHGKMVKELTKYLKKLMKRYSDGPPAGWEDGFKAILNEYLGTPPTASQMYGLNPDDYISLSSFSHHPFYKPFVLEAPDNWSNGSFYNLPIEELRQVAEYALQNGYSLTWDGDVSEKGFSARKSLAILPANTTDEGLAAAFANPGTEATVNEAARQTAFDRWKLTDDHLMHLTGLAEDQNGNVYFKVKNSWGTIGPAKGYLYMSSAYFNYGTVSILLHKDGIPAAIKAKLGMK